MSNKQFPQIKQLLTMQESALEQGYLCLSLYQPVTMTNLDLLAKEAKSLAQQCLKDNQTGNSTNLHRLIVETIQSRVTALSTLPRSLAMFLRFKPEELDGNHTTIKDEDIMVVSSMANIERYCYLDHIFDLRQLIWMLNLYHNSLVVNINKSNYHIYYIENDDFRMIYRGENVMLTDYTNRYFFASANGSPHSVGQVNTPGNTQSRSYLNEALTTIKEIATMQAKKFDYIIIFYTSEFSQLSEHTSSELRNYTEHPVILVNKNINVENSLKKEAWRIIDQRRAEDSKLELNNTYEETYKNYVEGWQNVANAVTVNQVHTLFIKPTSLQQGSITTDLELISPQDIADRHYHVANIAPWLVNKALKNGGNVSVIVEQNQSEPVIAAKLRY